MTRHLSATSRIFSSERVGPAAELVRLAWPITVSNLTYALTLLIDTAFVSHLGEASLAGVGLGAALYNASICFGFGTMRAVKTLLAQSRGQADGQSPKAQVGAALLVAWLVGIVVAGLGQLLALNTFRWAETAEAAQAAHTYLSVRVLGAPIMLTYVALRESRYGLGDTRSTMIVALCGNVLYALLDYIAVFVLEAGVAGVAVAGIVAYGLQAAALGFVQRTDGVAFGRAAIAALPAFLKVGAPTGFQWLMEVGVGALLSIILAGAGDVEIAAHQIGMQVQAFAFLPAFAIAEAANVLVAQAVGAGRPRQVPVLAKAALGVATAYVLLCSIAFSVFAESIVSMFHVSPVLAERAQLLLYVVCVYQLVDAAATVAHSVLRGAGDVRYSAVVGAAVAWICTPLLGYLLARTAGLGAPGAWLAACLELTVACALLWSRVLGIGWLRSALQARRSMRAAQAA